MKKIIRRILVALRLAELNRSAKVNQGNATVESIIARPDYFPVSESGTLVTALRLATIELSNADAATASGSFEKYSLADQAEEKWDMMMRNTAAYVQQKADANAEIAASIILSAGLKMKKEPVKATVPLPVQDVQAYTTGLGNAIKLTIVSANTYGCRYEVMMTETPNIATSWVAVANVTARKLLIRNLTNGTRYYFKSRAINNVGTSMYSEVISQIAA